MGGGGGQVNGRGRRREGRRTTLQQDTAQSSGRYTSAKDIFQPHFSGLFLVVVDEARPSHRYNAELDDGTTQKIESSIVMVNNTR